MLLKRKSLLMKENLSTFGMINAALETTEPFVKLLTNKQFCSHKFAYKLQAKAAKGVVYCERYLKSVLLSTNYCHYNNVGREVHRVFRKLAMLLNIRSTSQKNEFSKFS